MYMIYVVRIPSRDLTAFLSIGSPFFLSVHFSPRNKIVFGFAFLVYIITSPFESPPREPWNEPKTRMTLKNSNVKISTINAKSNRYDVVM